ncbi:MAG: hypothetical protein IJ071_07030 [Ruminococcus sp.]|nr:hypothetical protein [Ruminococcus sp.]
MKPGFSYIGLIWTKDRPKDCKRYAAKENEVPLAFERAGAILGIGRIGIHLIHRREYNGA